MGYGLKEKITSFKLAKTLGLKAVGRDLSIEGVASLVSAKEGSITFSKGPVADNVEQGVTIICTEGNEVPLGCCLIYCENPRLVFAKTVSKYHDFYQVAHVSKDAHVSASATLGNNISIGYGSVIGEDVKIGDNVEIGHNVTISDNIEIGDNTRIKSNSVIGEKGFGFEYDENGIPIEFPQIGGVRIGANVEIGALCTVASGTLDPTVIKDHVKIDDHVHIAHNVIVEEACIITAGAELSGGIKVGKRVWIGPQASIINKATIGDRAFIGIGAVVTKNVEELTLVAGNPAKRIKKLEPQ